MADLVYRPIVQIVKGVWRYLDIDFRFQGESHVPRKGPALLAMNHVSYLDFAIAGTAVLTSGRLVRFMAKKEIFDNPIAGPLMRGMKHISVDRKNGGPSFIAALRALKSGEIVGVFPEATISQSFELKNMKNGVIRLAMESGAPILPTVIWGSQRVWTKRVPRDFGRKKYPVFVSIGEPFTVSSNADVEKEMNRLASKLGELLAQVQTDYPDSPIGQRWAPARLGGTAPTQQELEARKATRKEI